MVGRVCVGLVALVLLAWLGVMERDTRLIAAGIDAAGPGGSRGDLPRAQAAFRRAGLLNPDTRPDVLEAAIQSRRGRFDQAVGGLEDVLRREPDNLSAWVVLLSVAREDPLIARRARAAWAQLDPLNAPR